MSRNPITLLIVIAAFGLAACGNTWEGLKDDTRENTNATGEVIEDAGEAIQEETE
ncbi:MAG: entericidin EcnAB [Geminicoccaceae bacterium]